MGSGFSRAMNQGWFGVAGEWVGDQMDKSKQKADRTAGAIEAQNAKAISDAKMAVESQAAQAQASISDKKRAISRSRSVYTSPLGVADQASTARKTLLGQ